MYRLAVFARKLAGVLQRRLRGTLLAGRAVAPFQPWRLYPAGNTVFLGSGHWEAPDNPQLLMFPPRDAWRAGLHQIRFRGAPQQDAKLHPRLYFDIGDGFEEAHTHQFPALGAEDQVFYVNIPAKTRAIRIDPLAQPARFPLHDVSLRKVSALRLALHIAQRKDTHRRHAFRALFLKRDYREALRIIAPSDNYAAADSTNYQRWLSEYEPSAGSDATRAQAHLQTLPTRPLISIVMPAYQSNIAWLKAAIDSVRAQYYADWELIVVDDASPDPDV